MKTLLWVVPALLVAGSAWAQENIFITNTSSGTVTVVDAQTLTALPVTDNTPNAVTSGPNQITVGATPTACLYDPLRNLVYVINSGPGTISVIDPNLFKVTATIQMPDAANLGGATLSMDGQFLYVCGFENIPKRAAAFRLDLNNLTNAGAKLVAGLAQGDGRNPSDVEVLSDRVYLLVAGQLYEIDFPIPPPPAIPPLDYPVMTLVPPVGGTNPPSVPTMMARSPDGRFILLTSNSNNAVGSAWQVIRLTPLPQTPTLPNTQLDFFQINNTGNAGNSIDDVLFLNNGGGSPFSAAILGRDDAGPKVVRFSVGATGNASGAVLGIGIQAQWGFGLTYDLQRDQYFVSGNINTSTPANYYLDKTPSQPPAQGASGGNGPFGFAFAPQPPRMQVDFVTQPAAVSTLNFQLEIHGSGFIPGSSRGRIQIGAAPNVFATTSTVLSGGVLLASFPSQPVAQMNVGVVNNDGQVSNLVSFTQGLNANPPSPPFTVPLPPLTSGYSMLSYPQYATVGDLRAAIAAQLGPYNPILFRLFLWQGKYYEINDPSLPPSLSIMGSGFMGLSRLGDQLTLTAPDVNANTTGPQRVVVILPGWSMISQPYHVLNDTLTTNLLRVTPNRNLGGFVPANNSGGLVTDVLFELKGNKYVTTTTMVGGNAYWILNQTSGPLYLIFVQGLVTKSIPPTPAPPAAPGTPMPPAPPGALGDSGHSHGGCGLLGPEFLLVVLFLRSRGRRKLAA